VSEVAEARARGRLLPLSLSLSLSFFRWSLSFICGKYLAGGKTESEIKIRETFFDVSATYCNVGIAFSDILSPSLPFSRERERERERESDDMYRYLAQWLVKPRRR